MIFTITSPSGIAKIEDGILRKKTGKGIDFTNTNNVDSASYDAYTKTTFV